MRYAGDGGYADCHASRTSKAVSIARSMSEPSTRRRCSGSSARSCAYHCADRPPTHGRARSRRVRDHFAALQVENRAPDQLLMRNLSDNTRSWFMVEAIEGADGTRSGGS